MPIVRVGGSDAESFDVAEMTDNQYAQQRNWSSPPSQAGVSLGSVHNILSPMPEIDDSTSTISSSRRTFDDITRNAGSVGPYGMKGIGSILIYTNSNHGITTASDKQSSRSSFSNMPLYEAVEKNYEMHHDPRNSFLETPPIGHRFVQAEDETSLSTMDDSFIPPCVGQQSSNHPTQQSWIHSQPKIQSQPRSYRNRPKHQSSIPEPVDDIISVQSNPSNQGSNTTDNPNHQKSAQSISALESLVAKLNFELATTKSSLDELALENRNLQQDKTSLSTALTKLQKENDRLRVHIVRLEKEKILRNIEGTKGVARPSVDLCLEWSDMAVNDNKWSKPSDASAASSNRVSVPTFNSESNGAGSVDALSGKKYRTSSYESFNDSSAAGDGDSDSDDAVSIKFSGSNKSLDSSHNLIYNGHEKKIGKGGLNFLNIFGGGKIEEDSKISDERLISSQQSARATIVEDSDDRNNDARKADDDPFETWSAPGDTKRNEPEQNWLQRGFGGLRKDSKQLRQCPQSNEIIEPFNSCNDNYHRDDKLPTSSRGGDSDIGPAMQEKSFGFFKGLGRGR